MPRIEQFAITLDNPQGVYYAGQIVSGYVQLEITKELDLKGLTLKCVGAANVHWSESRGSGKNRRVVHFRSSERYVDVKLTIYGDGTTTTAMPIGKHHFPFSITLPVNIPSSFQGDHGSVVYYLKAHIDRPWKIDTRIQLMLSVVALLDLNQRPGVTDALNTSGSKMFGCLCCKTGPLTATLTIPKGGYVSGETIFINANIDNYSDKVMTKSSIKLIETDIFKTPRKQRTVKRTVVRHDKESIAPGASFQWSNIGILIPPLPPSDLIYCNIIDSVYSVELSVDPSGIGFDLDVPLSIVIGTIPLRQMFQYIQHGTGALPAIPDYEASAPPPPSYGEVVFGGKEVEMEDEGGTVQGGNMFAPQYPTYKFSNA